MKSSILSSKRQSRFDPAVLALGRSALWVKSILARWNRMTHRRALQRLEGLNRHALRDIGLWREPESRLDEWWRTNPPP